ncbi:enoyl-CoA hydratase-related protein [Ruegeria sp.]|uniref:enoyl-CoA hydratase-related protein n=1 Tax=Ruegeria sp. TaxID=1879320 RepID=UPI003B5C6198
MSRFKHIIYGVEARIATITINRAEHMNTISVPVMYEMIDALDKADADDDVRVVIFTGAGDRAFCAGADLSGGSDSFDLEGGESKVDLPKIDGVYRDWGGMLTTRLFRCLKPVIAVVNGASAGIGATMQAAMDIRIASNKAKYVFPFTRRGIVPDAASSWFLTQIVGLPTALDWTMTGRVVPPEEALEKGMVSALHAPEDLMPAALKIAREIVENTSPVAVAQTRQMMWHFATADHPMAVHIADSRALQMRGASADTREGIAAFLEKRHPDFPDKVSDGLPLTFPDRSPSNEPVQT